MDPQLLLSALRKGWYVIVAIALVATGLAGAYAYSLDPEYRSTSSVYLSSQRGETPAEVVQGATFTQELVQSYTELATLPIVLDPVIAELGLDRSPQQLAGQITATAPLNTVIIDITVVDGSPDQAAAIANAVTDSLAEASDRLAPRGPDGESVVTVTTVSPAQVPSNPFSPNRPFLLATGLLAGLVLGLLAAIARELLDTRIRTERDIHRVSEAPLLGRIGVRPKSMATVVVRADARTPFAEDFRKLRTNLEFADIDRIVRSVVVTSPLESEGKSSVAINLALALAEGDRRVLLVDADLRRPSVAEYTQIDGSIGLTSLLLGSVPLDDAIQHRSGSTLDILPAGPVPPNPSQLLASDAMRALRDQLAARYDMVVIDAPPVLPVADALSLAAASDGTIVTVRHRSTRRLRLHQALTALDTVHARVLGVVLNGEPRQRSAKLYEYGPAEQTTSSPAAPRPDGGAASAPAPAGTAPAAPQPAATEPAETEQTAATETAATEPDASETAPADKRPAADPEPEPHTVTPARPARAPRTPRRVSRPRSSTAASREPGA